jgi:hypothetical protein
VSIISGLIAGLENTCMNKAHLRKVGIHTTHMHTLQKMHSFTNIECGSQQEIEGLKSVLKPLHQQPATARDRIRENLSHVELRLRTTQLSARQNLDANPKGATARRRPQTARAAQEHEQYGGDSGALLRRQHVVHARAQVHAEGNNKGGARSPWLDASFKANHGEDVEHTFTRGALVHDHDAGARPTTTVTIRTRRVYVGHHNANHDDVNSHDATAPYHDDSHDATAPSQSAPHSDRVKDIDIRRVPSSRATSEVSVQRTVSAVRPSNSDRASTVQVHDDDDDDDDVSRIT